MEKQKSWAKALQNFGVLLLGLASAGNFFSGLYSVYLGVFKSTSPKTAYHWIYIILGVLLFIFSIMMARAFIMLANRRIRGHHYGIIALVSGVGLGLAQMAAACTLTIGQDITVYVTYFTILCLAILMIFMIPFIWKELRFYGGRKN